MLRGIISSYNPNEGGAHQVQPIVGQVLRSIRICVADLSCSLCIVISCRDDGYHWTDLFFVNADTNSSNRIVPA